MQEVNDYLDHRLCESAHHPADKSCMRHRKTDVRQTRGELLAPLFERAIEQSRQGQRDLGKRRSPRIEATGELKLIPVEGGVPVGERVAVTLCNLSRDGIGLTTGRSLQEDSRHLVTLRRNGLPPMWLECAVRRCGKVGPHQYAIGAEFVAMHGQFELSIWGVDLEQLAPAA
jgi:hypothetical protein